MSNTTVNTTVTVNPEIVNEIKFEELREPLAKLVAATEANSGAIKDAGLANLAGAAVQAQAAKEIAAEDRDAWKDALFVAAALATVISTFWIMRQ